MLHFQFFSRIFCAADISAAFSFKADFFKSFFQGFFINQLELAG
jgi:hypothetical protein